MKRKFFLLSAVLLAALLLFACGRTPAPSALFEEFCKAYGDMPAGQVYRSSAREWEKGYLSPVLAEALFLEDNGENAFSLCSEYLVFLSTSFEGGEIAFLSCKGSADAVRIAEMCASRIARVRQVKPGSAMLQEACVLRSGNTVALLMLPDNARAREICDRLL